MLPGPCVFCRCSPNLMPSNTTSRVFNKIIRYLGGRRTYVLPMAPFLVLIMFCSGTGQLRFLHDVRPVREGGEESPVMTIEGEGGVALHELSSILNVGTAGAD